MYESHFTMLDEEKLIDKLQEGLKNQRYLIVIDDIWDDKLWEVIKLAFSKSNNLGSRLITTTRIASVSRVCCSSSDDSVYKMEPLSDDDSKRLFYKRIFPPEIGCPSELQEVSIEILKKCGGVPLAIITVASLLASDQRVKHVDEWNDLLGSIGRGLKEDPSVNEMLKILSFSYYDLPSHLKTCLLYLSMFPEDHEIKKDRLIWMWIAENFVQSKKGKSSLFEIRETYFNELVNRNMIMPVYSDYYDHTVEACRVHDMVLDLISSLASEENFVTVWNGTDDSMSSVSSVRRLSLQEAREGELQTKPLEAVSVFKVRTVAAFGPGIGLVPSFSSFVVLRVLDLTGCYLGDHSHLNLRDLGSMLHLRYLSLAHTRISKVPEEVGKLQFLLVLDLSGNDDVELPSSIIKLTRLMCLMVDDDKKRLPDGLENLASMEVLGDISCDSISKVKELGGMEKLRELEINFPNWNLQQEEAFVESLGKMSNIQRLLIRYQGEGLESMDILGERWMPPRSLESIYLHDMVFSTVPACISRDLSHLSQLSMLYIAVKKAWQEDLDILGRLTALRDLSLRIERWSGVLLFGADGFHCLTYFSIYSWSPGQVVFKTGAMPKAERVVLYIGMQVINEQAVGNNGDYSDLPSLGYAEVAFFRAGVPVGEAKQAEAALTNALRAHPNHPTFDIHFNPSIRADAADDDISYESEEEE
ncbi:unnamed protein product [Alopecurus aequalis]